MRVSQLYIMMKLNKFSHENSKQEPVTHAPFYRCGCEFWLFLCWGCTHLSTENTEESPTGLGKACLHKKPAPKLYYSSSGSKVMSHCVLWWRTGWTSMNFWWETQQTAISTNEGLFSQYQIKPKGKHAFASFFFFFLEILPITKWSWVDWNIWIKIGPSL